MNASTAKRPFWYTSAPVPGVDGGLLAANTWPDGFDLGVGVGDGGVGVECAPLVPLAGVIFTGSPQIRGLELFAGSSTALNSTPQ